MMKDIAVFGAGGFGKEVSCLIQLINEKNPVWNFVGFFDDNPVLRGTKDEYGEVLGGMEELNKWETPLALVIAIGNPVVLRKIVENITNANIYFPNLIAPTTVFLDEKSVVWGKGNIICSNCLISLRAKIGNFNIFNGYIPLGHDTVIGDYNVVMPSVNISGGVQIGDNNFFGVQSVVLQYLKIGNNVRIGANSVMMRNSKDNCLYLGNPAKKTSI